MEKCGLFLGFGGKLLVVLLLGLFTGKITFVLIKMIDNKKKS